MKKLIALSLVLAVAGLANAGFVVTYKDGAAGVKAGDTFNVAFYNTEGYASIFEARIISDSAVPSGVHSNVQLADGFTLSRQLMTKGPVTDGSGYLVYNTGGTSLGGSVGTGVRIATGTKLFSFDVTVGDTVADGEYAIDFTHNQITNPALIWGTWTNHGLENGAVGTKVELGSVSYTVVPEPITMGLLSLGALFIRKRK